MPRGGPRSGSPGRAYPNRADLNQNRQLPASAAAGQPYGQRQAQLDSQAAVPMAAPPAFPAPGSLGPLDAPTARPGEPLTTGAPVGPGPGPEALQLPGVDALDELRALYQRFPTEELRQIIEEAESE